MFEHEQEWKRVAVGAGLRIRWARGLSQTETSRLQYPVDLNAVILPITS